MAHSPDKKQPLGSGCCRMRHLSARVGLPSDRAARVYFERLLEAFGCGEQIAAVDYVGDADLVVSQVARGIEARSRGDHDRLSFVLELLEQPLREALAAVDRQLDRSNRTILSASACRPPRSCSAPR